jgi:hypothetical protein
LVTATHAQRIAQADDVDGSRGFFHWDMNTSGFYSSRGAFLTGTGAAHWQPTDRIPRNYVGGEYIYTTGEHSLLRHLLGQLEFTTMDLNPHIEVDFNPPLDPQPSNASSLELNRTSVDVNSANNQNKVRVKLVLYDFWLRFEPAGLERTTIRVGHFDIPYGVNPVMAPRGGVFVMPPEIDDIGFKKDWGAVWKAPLGHYDYELALTTGTGLGLHTPRLNNSSKTSFLVTGRVGAPTYWDFQYGLSGLLGKIPQVMADEYINGNSMSQWRIGIDGFYKLQEHTIFMSQVGYGQGAEPFLGSDQRTNRLATHLLIDHIPWWFQLMDFKVQLKGIFTDLGHSHSDHTTVLFEAAYSLSDAVMVRFDYVHDINVTSTMEMMGMPADDRFYMEVNYYL